MTLKRALSEPITSGCCVRLKSGGPSMTVRAIEGDDVDVEWFEKLSLHGHRFKVHSLVRTRAEQLPISMIDLEGVETNDHPH